MKRLLVIRFSAIGDVAMTIPVLYSVAIQNPDWQISVLSRKVFQPLFTLLPDNVSFVPADLKGEHKGILGLMALYKELRVMKFDVVVDLHNVLRTRLLRMRFWLNRVPVAVIDKGNSEKNELIRAHNKKMRPLKTSFERYAEVFSQVGLSYKPSFVKIEPLQILADKGDMKWVGVAPFAAHQGKIYPLDKMETLIGQLVEDNRVKVFLFGGGKRETEILQSWAAKYPRVEALPGRFDMAGELALMNQLDVMVSMDSGNMHLASLVATPVVSIWGATHPWCGFMGWNQSIENVVQLEMACRPCSVYGNKPCRRKNYGCMNNIEPEQVCDKIKRIIALS